MTVASKNGKQSSTLVSRRSVRRVALISDHASPLADPGSVDSGGQNVYVAQVARHLARQGIKVDVFTRRDNDNLPGVQIWEDGVRVIHVPAGPPEYVRKEELLPFMNEFAAFIIEFSKRQGVRYDLIHANFWMSALVAIKVKQAIGIPFVVTFHALGRVRRQYQGKDDGFPDVRFVIEDQAIQEADRIIAECPQDEQDLICLYHAAPEKLVVIPCGFDPSEVWPLDKALSRRMLGLPENEPVILQLGRMVPRKGVDNALRGFARLVKKYGIAARLLIVGGGSEEPDPEITPEIGRLQTIAEEEGVTERVTFVGRRGRKALKHYYSAADVLISTPWYEPFGITPVEAMACGTPVIGSDVGGIKYTISHGITGYLVPPNDPEALAESLADLYRHPKKLVRFSQQAVKRANQLFTWQKVSEAIASLFDEVVQNRSTESMPSLEVSLEPVLSEASSECELAGENTSLSASSSSVSVSVSGLDSCTSTIESNQVLERGFDTAIRVSKQSRKMLNPSVLAASQAIVNCLAQGGKVMGCGNGGSAADAQHFAAEFVGRFIYPDRKGLPVMALTADNAFLTAWSNDVSYEKVFARQVEFFGQPGDLPCLPAPF